MRKRWTSLDLCTLSWMRELLDAFAEEKRLELGVPESVDVRRIKRFSENMESFEARGKLPTGFRFRIRGFMIRLSSTETTWTPIGYWDIEVNDRLSRLLYKIFNLTGAAEGVMYPFGSVPADLVEPRFT